MDARIGKGKQCERSDHKRRWITNQAVDKYKRISVTAQRKSFLNNLAIEYMRE